MTQLHALDELDSVTLLQCLLFGEARGEGLDGMAAVAWVVRNRAVRPSWWGRGWKEVMLKNLQFSCFNKNDPNLTKIYSGFPFRWTNETWRECRFVAFGVKNDWIVDPTRGADHYHSTMVKPFWAENVKPTRLIGSQLFYKLRED